MTAPTDGSLTLKNRPTTAEIRIVKDGESNIPEWVVARLVQVAGLPAHARGEQRRGTRAGAPHRRARRAELGDLALPKRVLLLVTRTSDTGTHKLEATWFYLDSEDAP